MEIPLKILRMIDCRGFMAVFNEELEKRRKADPKISEKQVFDDLNDEYYQIFNKFRYSDYYTFKVIKRRIE